MRLLFSILRWLLVTTTGRGYDRSNWINSLHHKIAYRLHKLLPRFGIAGLQRVTTQALHGKHLYVHAEDGGVGHQFIMYHEYEPYETQLLQKYLKPGITVYNIGANLGYYMLIASDCVGPKGHVYGFEPALNNLSLLRRTLSENQLTNTTIMDCAVGAEDGQAMLSLSPTNSGDHQLSANSGRDQVSVQVRSIDSLIESGLPQPDAIIMDVQGSELDVLHGMSKLLSKGKPTLMLTEFWPKGIEARHPNGADEFVRILCGAGFSDLAIDSRLRQVLPLTSLQKESGYSFSEINLLCLREKV